MKVKLAETENKKEISGAVRTAKVQTGREQIERDQEQDLRSGEMRRGRDAGPGGAKKADDE